MVNSFSRAQLPRTAPCCSDLFSLEPFLRRFDLF